MQNREEREKEAKSNSAAQIRGWKNGVKTQFRQSKLSFNIFFPTDLFKDKTEEWHGA